MEFISLASHKEGPGLESPHVSVVFLPKVFRLEKLETPKYL